MVVPVSLILEIFRSIESGFKEFHETVNVEIVSAYRNELLSLR